MKKSLAVIISLVLVMMLFAACGNTGTGSSGGDGGGSSGSGGSAGKTVVQFWGHVNEAWNNSHKATIERFNASQDEIEVVPTFFPYDDFEAKIQTSLMTGGGGADIYEIWGGWGLDFVDSGALSPVPEYLIKEIIADCYEPVIGAFYNEEDGKYYGAPVEFNNEYGGMLVNKTKFEELGIAYPTKWDEIMDIARANSVSNGPIMEMRGLDFTTDDTLTTTFLSMILSSGGEYFVDGKFSLTSPKAVEALQYLVDLVKVDKVTNLDSATSAQGAEIDGAHFLGRDEALMVPRGPWVISLLEEEYDKHLGVDFDYIKFPFYGPTAAFPAETGWSICVPKDTKVDEAAWKYIEFFLEKENLMQHNIACAQIPPLKSVATDPEYVAQLPYMEPLIGVLDAGKFIGPFNTDVLKISLRNTFVSLCTDEGAYASVADALATLEKQLNSDLKLG
jgi:multiple sugar transport system substrate-binding protein